MSTEQIKIAIDGILMIEMMVGNEKLKPTPELLSLGQAFYEGWEMAAVTSCKWFHLFISSKVRCTLCEACDSACSID